MRCARRGTRRVKSCRIRIHRRVLFLLGYRSKPRVGGPHTAESIGEGLDIGEDVGSAVDFTYKLPFTFTGTIDKVTFDFK
jgi:hypothetical protein